MNGIRPSVALEPTFAVASTSTDPGSVTLVAAAMTTVVCPFHTVIVDGAFDIAPCGTLALGFTRPQVHDLAAPNESAQPLITPGVDLRALVWLDAIGVRFTAGSSKSPSSKRPSRANVRPLFTTPPVALHCSHFTAVYPRSLRKIENRDQKTFVVEETKEVAYALQTFAPGDAAFVSSVADRFTARS